MLSKVAKGRKKRNGKVYTKNVEFVRVSGARTQDTGGRGLAFSEVI